MTKQVQNASGFDNIEAQRRNPCRAGTIFDTPQLRAERLARYSHSSWRSPLHTYASIARTEGKLDTDGAYRRVSRNPQKKAA